MARNVHQESVENKESALKREKVLLFPRIGMQWRRGRKILRINNLP